jgi:hypothetical protein
MCILPKACVSNAPGAVLGRKDDLMVETPEIKACRPCTSLEGTKDVRVVNCLLLYVVCCCCCGVRKGVWCGFLETELMVHSHADEDRRWNGIGVAFASVPPLGDGRPSLVGALRVPMFAWLTLKLNSSACSGLQAFADLFCCCSLSL